MVYFPVKHSCLYNKIKYFFSLALQALRACEARAPRARKTLTPRFTDFFTDFEKKRTILQSSEIPFFNRGYMKGVPFLTKMLYIKGVGPPGGASPY